MQFLIYRKIALAILTGVLLVSPLVAFAQSDYVLQPVQNYRDRDLSGENIRSCFSSGLLDFLGADECGNQITEEVLETVRDVNDIPLTAGDVLRCAQTDNTVATYTGDAVCTVTHTDGSADSATQTTTGGMIRSHTDSTGNTTAGERSNVFDQAASGAAGLAEEVVSSVLGPIAEELITGVAWVILKLASYLLAAAGTLLNWVMLKAVFQFSTLIGASPGLLIAWSILRDIANMLLLFGFIFIGIAMILDLHSYPAKKALPRLIIFAILMNFSLFIAGAVIDTSNGLSSVLYSQANTDPCATGTALDEGPLTQEECSVNYGIAGHIMQATGLTSIYKAGGVNLQPVPTIGLALFALVGAFVFFAAAIMLIIRAVVLAFLMVLAPIGFAALAVPPLEKHGKDWWNRLIHQSFFAPIFLLLVFVSLKITDGFADAAAKGSLAAAITHPEASVMGVIMVFALVIGFLIFSLVAAKKFGAMGADFAIKTAGGLSYGTLGVLGRRTAGRASYATAKAVRGSSYAGTFLGRKLAGAADYGAKATYDMRTTKPFTAGAKMAGIDAGEPSKRAKGGYKGIVHEKEEERKKYAESMTLSPHDQHTHLQNRLALRNLQPAISQLEEQISQARNSGAQALVGVLTAQLTPLQNERTRLQSQNAALDRELFDRRLDFANRLDNSLWSNTVGQVTGGRAFNAEGAHAIREWLAESPQQRLLRQLNSALAAGQQPPQPAAPAPAAPPGGGAGAAPQQGAGGAIP